MSGLISAIASVSIGATTAGMSFAQMARANREARAAGRLAAEAREEIDKRNEQIFSAERAVQKQVYEQNREELRRAGSDLLSATRQADQRGVAAGTQGLLAGIIEGEGQIGQAQEAELVAREKDIIGEKQTQRTAETAMLAGDIAGAQTAIANKEAMAANALQSGVTSAASALASGIGAVGRLRDMSAARQDIAANIDPSKLTSQQISQLEGVPGFEGIQTELVLEPGQEFATTVETMETFDPSVIGKMSPKEFRQFERGLTPVQQQALFGTTTPGILKQLGQSYRADNMFAGNQGGLGGLDFSKLTDAQKQYLIQQLVK